ncbi:ABC transporter substrate-binding protein [Erwinia amylovora]
MTLRIGCHPSNLSLFILRHRGALEARAEAEGWQVVWKDYHHGGDSADYLRHNQLDVVGTGSTPPVYAQASGLDVAYLGASPSRDANCALLVMKESERQAVQQIAGARIACMKGSFTDHFIARLLQQNGLSLKDITLVDLGGSDSARALRLGDVDVWAAIDPWLGVAQEAKRVRTLARVGDYVANRSVFWCRRGWQQQHPQQAQLVLEVLAENDRWVAEHPKAAAQLLNQHLPDSISAASWLTTICARPWGISAVSATLLTEQQQQADDLYATGFLDQPLTLTAPTLTGSQA